MEERVAEGSGKSSCFQARGRKGERWRIINFPRVGGRVGGKLND
jgi:hypothetical protein